MIFQRAYQHDLPILLNIYQECLDFLQLAGEVSNLQAIIEHDLIQTSKYGGLYQIIYNGAIPIGVLDVIPGNFNHQPHVAFIELLMLAKPYRGQGYGREVVQRVEKEIWNIPQITEIQLAVQENNLPGIQFWMKSGYQPFTPPTLQEDGTITRLYQKKNEMNS